MTEMLRKFTGLTDGLQNLVVQIASNPTTDERILTAAKTALYHANRMKLLSETAEDKADKILQEEDEIAINTILNLCEYILFSISKEEKMLDIEITAYEIKYTIEMWEADKKLQMLLAS